MARLNINCLGAFQATWDGEPLAFDTGKARALLAYLALESSFPQQRTRLAGLLWSDMPEERALHNLRQALSGLRKTLRDDGNTTPILLIQRDTVQINPESDLWLDVTAFEQKLSAALRHYQHCPGDGRTDRWTDCRLNLRQLQQAVNLFRGPFLDQMYLNGSPLFDEWASLKREALNQRMIEALSIMAELHERRGELAQARQFASQIVALAPWDETAQVQMMRLLAVEGHWSAAQTQYRHLRCYLQEQIGVEPSAETVTLFETIRRSAAQNTPLPAQHPLARHNLPLSSTPFVGRESELDSLSAALADPCCRLLTLTGPGGVGKTRLALEAARQQVGVFSNGITFVPLAALTSEDLLPAALADALGFTFFGDESASRQLLHFVGEKRMLWLLDNLEQLLPLAAGNLIPQVLQHAPGIVILATSRQRLNVQDECLFPVEGLPYPAQTDTSGSEHFAALQLFASRAQRVQPLFNLADEATRQAAARICQLVEGLPLGVELAAATLWAHTTTEIAANLSDSLHSLTSAAVNASGRHRSLWAAFEVSWGLLSADEQSLLAQLSVFRGGFEAGMAQQLMGAPGALLASLLDKSLLRRDAAGRYIMHEAIRQFAAEKLAGDAAQSSAAHAAHAQGYADFLAARVKPLKSTGQVQSLAEIALEWDNVRQAWGWLVAQQHTVAISASAEAIFHFCNIRTRYREGIDLFTQAVGCLENTPISEMTLAQVLTYLGALAYRASDNTLSHEALSRALALYESLDAPNDLALCLLFTSSLAARRKERENARQLCEQALALFQQTGDVWGQSYTWYQLGLLDSCAGQLPETQAAMQASLQAARAIGDQRRQIGPLNILGDLACQLGRCPEAQTYFEESLSLSRILEDHFNTALALVNLGTAFHCTESYDQAQRCYEKSLSIACEIGDLGGQSLALVNLGELALVRQQFAEGIAYFQQGLALATKAKDEWGVLICWICLSDAALEQADQAAARQYLGQALPLAAQSGEPALILRTLLHLGRLYLLQGETEKAIALLGLVIHHEVTYDEHRQVALQTLAQAGLPVPQTAILTLDAALGNALRDGLANPVFSVE
ncbi:MAG: tetratricopeptide repeat protein [Chloroflexi bacterium]|nr:tetratricopeptide repeat protein [Chloroflexota bacterium]